MADRTKYCVLHYEITDEDEELEVAVIPLRGIVIFPKMTLNFDVGRKKSISALNRAFENKQKVLLVCQRDAAVDEPEYKDLYDVGVLCSVKQLVHIPNSDNLSVLVEGEKRMFLRDIVNENQITGFVRDFVPSPDRFPEEQERAYCKMAKSMFRDYCEFVAKISDDIIAKVPAINDMGELADFICANSFFDYKDKQTILSFVTPSERLAQLIVILRKENSVLELRNEIKEKVKQQLDKNQRDYVLREQMKAIADTLGEGENPIEEADEYRAQIENLQVSDEIKQKLLKECEKLMKMPGASHEGTVVRNYLDKCLEIPFGKYTKDRLNLQRARKILDRDHYALDKVKERIVDSLAVYKRNPAFSGQILCLAGPPGVGKTSIVRSLAECMGRKYVRISLGGIHDEAEIRGHRRTYIGSMPGRIIEAVIKSGVMNPIILLDEIDKVGYDYRGDPSSALLEALDPEQNGTFADHYIEFPIDLSRVLFITTANDTSTISTPLYDRMEIIELNSYTSLEKFHIAKEHLIKKELKRHKISARELKISDDAIKEIIEHYTREAGVRKLEKAIASICRKATVMLESGKKTVKVTADNLGDFLGKRKYTDDLVSKENLVGTVNGLAWTSVGGTMLPIEVSALKGTGKIKLTGNLGDIMKESAKTAVSYIRSKASEYGIKSDFYKTTDIHIHAPESAIPKDGPSAGLAITTAVLSELTGIPIKSSVAMTGEISLKGKALAIGGLREKSTAAYKAGCKTVIIPEENKKDLDDISSEVKDAIEFITVSNFDEVIPIALTSAPTPRKTKEKS